MEIEQVIDFDTHGAGGWLPGERPRPAGPKFRTPCELSRVESQTFAMSTVQHINAESRPNHASVLCGYPPSGNVDD